MSSWEMLTLANPIARDFGVPQSLTMLFGAGNPSTIDYLNGGNYVEHSVNNRLP